MLPGTGSVVLGLEGRGARGVGRRYSIAMTVGMHYRMGALAGNVTRRLWDFGGRGAAVGRRSRRAPATPGRPGGRRGTHDRPGKTGVGPISDLASSGSRGQRLGCPGGTWSQF